MDPVSHVAFGRTLIALDGRRSLGAGAIAACLVGSLTPDLDAVFMPIGWDIYLRRHQGGTHSLIGSIACAAVTAGVVRLSTKRSQYVRLLLAAWAGAVGHLLLDVISGADVRFFWPLGRPVTLPLFAMADPWLGGALILGVVMLAIRRSDSPRMAAGILVGLTALAGAKGALYAEAWARAEQSEDSVLFRRAQVEWGSLTRWITYDTMPRRVEARRINALTGTITAVLDVPRGLDDPIVARSRELETVRNLVAAHGVTFATVVRARAKRTQVLWSDLRYCGPPATRSTPWAPIPLEIGLPVACTFWFGGEFDPATGVPRDAIVYVGHIKQRRPPP